MQNRVNSHSGLNQKPAKHTSQRVIMDTKTRRVSAPFMQTMALSDRCRVQVSHMTFTSNSQTFPKTLLSLKKLLLSYTHSEYSRLKLDKFGVFFLSSVAVSPISPLRYPLSGNYVDRYHEILKLFETIARNVIFHKLSRERQFVFSKKEKKKDVKKRLYKPCRHMHTNKEG